MNDTLYILCLLVWVVIGLIAALKARDPARRGVGLTVAFIINMALNHWFGALVCLLPWYSPAGNDQVVDGFELSTLGMVGFAVGCFVIGSFVSPAYSGDDEEPEPHEFWHPRVLRTYALVGIGSYVATTLGARALPSLASVLSVGFNFVLVTVCLAMWWSRQRGEQARVHGWLVAAFALPLFTMVTQGFLGYGIGYLIVVFSFYLLLSRHRAALLVAVLPLAFVGLSFYVSYMRDRVEIREAVWGGKAYGSRFDSVWHTCSTIEWFDPFDIKHLQRVDERLNQNRLVGAATQRLQSTHSYARGETIWMAFLAIIPRAVWADKPQYAGGMDLVSKYTGLMFAPGTSIGLGPIFELEINFGHVSVLLGMLLIGALIGVADAKAGLALRLDDPLAFGKWFLIGIVMQSALGSFAELTASLAAALILVTVVNRYLQTHPDSEFPELLNEHRVIP